MPCEEEEAGNEERSAPVEEEKEGEGFKERVNDCFEGMPPNENKK